MEQRLKFCQTLPTLPRVALEVIDLGKNPAAGLPELAQIVVLDPALSVKILKVANSSLYGLRRKTENVRQALAVMGFDAALTLVLSFSLSTSINTSYASGLDKVNFWHRSVLTATIARCLGEQLEMSRLLEELFLAGLLQDIGILALHSMVAQDYEPLLEAAQNHDHLAELEREQWQADHTEVGAWLLNEWALPNFIQSAVAGSHDPGQIETSSQQEVNIIAHIAVANRIADVWMNPGEETLATAAIESAREWLDIGESEYTTLQSRVAEAIPEISVLFEIDLPDPQQTMAILDQAREILAVRNLQLMREAKEAQHKIKTLETRTRSLEEQTRHDTLTGAYNRSYLDAVLEREFQLSKQQDWPISLAFIDLDHFKRVNDTYGHQAGDKVLVAVAHLLLSSIRQSDILARYGGEEFVLALPGTNREGGKLVMERLLKALEAEEHHVAADAIIHVTASIGLTTFDNERRFESVFDLLRTADEAVYAAKAKGRNCLVIV